MSIDPRSWSVAAKANVFIASFFPALFTVFFVIVVAELSKKSLEILLFGFVAFFIVGQFFFRCYQCKKNVYRRVSGGFLGVDYVAPWSETTCSKCGADLTVSKAVDG
ncbi:hypothetical protein GCM10009096_15960 [Parasphingorhabdus litoris]|uniref:CXXC-20-CXXC protein n=1 Tax=Parasphingorhabdus litoris TaxID=394733 RepID=A0ABP3KAW2_9SPHN